MKKIFSLLLAASAFACTQEKVVEITISNPSTTDRTNEITEITSDAITKLKGETFIISDNTGSQVPYQITYDNKIIFPVSVKGGENVTYKITPGTPEAFKTIACGKQYPERVDDIARKQELRLQNCARPTRKQHSNCPNLFPIISIMVTDWITIR